MTNKTTNTQANKVEEILSQDTTKSSKIRQLSSIGLTRSQISNKLNIRYQHVRNVLVNPPKKKED